MVERFIPALGWRLLTPLYDPLVRLALPETTLKRDVVSAARVGTIDRVLDVGCGTGTLVLMVLETASDACVIGLDGDPEVLRLASRKAKRTGQAPELHCGLASSLPYRDSVFDRVLSTLAFHHLSHEVKVDALREVHRVLRPGGELHLQDFDKPHNRWARFVTPFWRLFEGRDESHDNVQGRLPRMMRDAGFEEVQTRARFTPLFGTVASWSARKPG